MNRRVLTGIGLALVLALGMPKMLGLTFPPALLARADEVIQ